MKRDIGSEIAGEFERVRATLKVPSGRTLVSEGCVTADHLVWSVILSEWLRPATGEIDLPVKCFYGVCK